MKNSLPILIAIAVTAMPASVRSQVGPTLPGVSGSSAAIGDSNGVATLPLSLPTTEPVRMLPPAASQSVPMPIGPEAGGVLNVDDSAQPVPQPSAAALVEAAAMIFTRRYSVAAKIRHRAYINGHEMVGVGEYWQGPASSRLMRYELRMQVGRRIIEQLQINDGRYLWRQTRYEKEPETERIDVDRALAAALGAGTNGPDLINVLGMGGLGRLLESLRKDFDFTEVFRSQLDGLPVYGVVGRWKPAVYATFNAATPDKLRSHLPDQVTLYLGCDDSFLYRIDYQRSAVGAGEGGTAKPRPLLRMELFEVRFDAPLDDALFHFDPGKQLFVDATDRFVGTRNNAP